MARKEQIDQLGVRLDELNGRIRAMERELGRIADSKRRETYRGELKVLREKRHVAEERLAELRLREAESWEDEDFLSGVLEIFDEIGERLQRLGERVRGGS